MSEERLELGLLTNAIDYLDSAAEHALAQSPRDWKYALLHVTAGVELLLKASLAKADWHLLFEDPDKADRRAFELGDFLSISAITALKRLEDLGIEFPKEDRNKLEHLRRFRNRIQHFAIDVPQEQVVSLVAFACHFCVDLIHNHHLANEEVTDEVRDLGEKLRDFDEYVDVRMGAKKTEIETSYFYMECPECLQEALVLGDLDPRCLFCNYTDSPAEVASRISPSYDPKDGSPIEDCPECSGPCFYLIEEGYWVCFACGETGNYRHCTQCGSLMDGDDLRCNDCWDYLVSRD